jgi:N-methylhydantoinase A
VLRAAGVDAVAICFLHAYANPDHELRARDIVLHLDPTMHVSLSSEVMNAMREFERTSTVVVDAYVKPVMADYLRRLERSIEIAGLTTRLQVMQSSGGVMTSDDSADLPIHTLLSGPAGGVIAARHLAARSGYPNVITLDIGGTSADVALIIDGEPELTTETEVDWGIPVQVPMIDIRTIGAGGGSVARLDRGGRLKVGPESAGARPGPACFGHGGEYATVTDANLVLGYLNSDNYAGGTFPLDATLAVTAIEQNVGGPLGFDLDSAARGVLDIINANMRNLIRQITVQQGHDPREFALMAFGGGGPVHAVAVARELGIRTVLIPPTPGVLSAFGLLLAVPRHDFVQSLPRALGELEWVELESVIETLGNRGRELLAGAGVDHGISTTVSLDMQFERQNYTLNVVLRDGIADVEALRAAFDESYEQKFGYRMDEQPVVIVNCRVSVAAESDSIAGRAALAPGHAERVRHDREVFFEEWGHRAMCPIIERSALRAGDELVTPCIVEQADTSVVIPPGVMAAVDDHGMIVVRLLDLPTGPKGTH